MLFLCRTLLVLLIGGAECQVIFPTVFDCIASNMHRGICHKSTSSKMKRCSYFPSTDSSIPEVAEHLLANVCKKTDSEIHFCCPSINIEDNVFTPKEKCPISVSNNIVGGNFTDPGTFPWLAAIGKKEGEFEPFCGGVLITNQHVISAAHCFNNITTDRTIVRLGEHNWQVPEGEEQDYNIIDHRMRNYDRKTKENDIIVLKLHTTVKIFSDFIKAACLPYELENNTFEGNSLTVVGWGVFDNNQRGKSSPVPLKGNVPVVPLTECQQNYVDNIRTNSIIDNRQLCAGIGNTDSCNGDSGGPIHYLDGETGHLIVVGIVSFGPKLCGYSGLPGVYTRIDYHMNWIEDNIRDMEG